MRFVFTPRGWEDYTFWQAADWARLKRINRLLDDIARDPFAGIGKPKRLRHAIVGAWSRRIDGNIGWCTSSTGTTWCSCRLATAMAEAEEPRGVLEFGVAGLNNPAESNSADIEAAWQVSVDFSRAINRCGHS